MKFASFVIFAVRSCGSWLLVFCGGILWILYLDRVKINLYLRSCGFWIIKDCSVVGSWGCWILRILDPKFLFHYGILEILDIDVLVLKWDSGDPGS